MALDRREFLKTGAAMAASFALAPALRPSRAAQRGPAAPRALVLVELNGGHDGLSTIVPVHDSRYHDARKKLAIPESAALRLDERTFVAPELATLEPHWKSGRVAVLECVGYPKADRSHFRSMDIWHTASTNPGPTSTGWIGRAAAELEKLQPGVERPLFAIGDGPAPLLFAGAPRTPIVLGSLDKVRAVERRKSSAPAGMPAPSAGGEMRFLASQDDALKRIGAAVERVKRRQPAIEYPRTPLGRHFSIVAGLIDVGFDGAVFHLRLDGFDTHAAQRDALPLLLETVAKAVSAFLGDLEKAGKLDRVLVVAFSEFGRRVAENGSAGTDHGAAGPMLFFGSGFLPGRRNAPPDLEHLADGDLVASVDFRTVYAAILERWLGLPGAGALVSAPSGHSVELFA